MFGHDEDDGPRQHAAEPAQRGERGGGRRLRSDPSDRAELAHRLRAFRIVDGAGCPPAAQILRSVRVPSAGWSPNGSLIEPAAAEPGLFLPLTEDGNTAACSGSPGW